jgi:hypothetical protein
MLLILLSELDETVEEPSLALETATVSCLPGGIALLEPNDSAQGFKYLQAQSPLFL